MSSPEAGPSLTRRVTVGALWLVAGRWSMRLIGLISTVLLARLLTPEDFGIVVLAGLVVGVLDALTDFRFGQALVHYQDATDDEYNTAWTFNVLRGLTVAAVLAGGSWLFASLFKEPRLVEVFWVLAVVAVLDGLQNIGTIQFTKEMRFGPDFVLRLGHKLSSFVVCVGLALVWQSYWALVAGMVAGSMARTVLSYVMHPYRPAVCISGWRRIFGFSAWLMGGQVISHINQRLEQFLIGAFMSPPLVGLYNLAYELSSMATSEIVGPATQALFPGYAKISDDKQRLREAYEKSVQFVVAVGTPLGILLALVAAEFILIVLGPKWIEAELPLQVLSAMFSISVLAMASTSLLPAMGRTRDVFIIDCTLLVGRVPLTAFLIWQFGFAGAAWARFASGLWWVIHYILMIRSALGISFARIIALTHRSYMSALLMVGAVLLMASSLDLPNGPELNKLTLWQLAAQLGGKLLIGLFTYGFAHYLLWRLAGRPTGPETILISLLKSKVSHFRRNTPP